MTKPHFYWYVGLNWRLPIYGTEAPWLQNTVTHFQAKGIHVIDFANGFLEQEEYLKRIDEFSPDVVLLGMGMPKQEVLAEKIKTHCKNSNMIIICGGAIIDFLGGRFPRAPLFIRKAKLEWLFRLSKEPKRLFRRYVVGNVEFLWKVVLIKYFK
ncbi:WecB/TagA/CpsF family glycosyltransferase [Alteromonas macleodii]|uniref:WecB/TagA/CpsF family glycosyltransferase n=1 Tax=Alteromonas macleodii TaxID=28108 RepID=UPI001930904F|nr:WecB/TagA/CpsF family glycosyltransferase [Alteromonas macleodii]